MTEDQLRETAEEIDNTVLQQVTNRGLKPGYVRDLVLAAVTEELAEQKMVNGVFAEEPWEVAFENSYPPRNDTPRSREDFRAGFEAGYEQAYHERQLARECNVRLKHTPCNPKGDEE